MQSEDMGGVMEGKKKCLSFKYIRALLLASLAGILVCFGMKDYVNVGNFRVAVAQLYGDDLTISQAEKIWKDIQNSNEASDLCFVWDGGIREIYNPLYLRQTNVRVTGITGISALYDRQATVLDENDENGCIIDKNTALELFGSENCVGSQLTMKNKSYVVRGVASWKQHVFLIRSFEKNMHCTQVLIECKKAQTREMAVSVFLMGNGLSGMLADDSWLDVILPWFFIAFFIKLAILARKKEVLPASWKGVRFILKISIWGICLFLILKFLSDIPQSWLPDKWSDFSFWSAKIRDTSESANWYLTFPKTPGQSERLLGGISCMVKCAGAVLLLDLASI